MADVTEFDLLQLIDLDTKARNEGSLSYTVENWTWEFDNPALDAASRDGDVDTIQEALRATYAQREHWWADHPHPTQIAALEAHEAEVEQRAEAGVRPEAGEVAGE